MQLQLQDLCKQYGTKCAVNHVNANLALGVYGLLGANGAGKTKLVTANASYYGRLWLAPCSLWNRRMESAFTNCRYYDSLSVYIPASDPYQSRRYLFATDCYDWSDIAFIC